MALDLQSNLELGCPSNLQVDPIDLGDRHVTEQDFSAHVEQDTDGLESLRLIVRGAHCGGCMRKIEEGLSALDGVHVVRFNLTTSRLFVSWAPGPCNAEMIRQALSSLGYAATPDLPDQAQNDRKSAENRLLKAMAVAGFATMNVMMLSVAIWADVGEMSATTRQGIHAVSALIALPALAYSGRIFFQSAWSALKVRQTNMDVPISLAIILATGLSLYETIIGHADTYFDASLMLVFLLLIGRFLDARLRAKAGDAAHSLAAMRVSSATRIDSNGHLVTVPSADIRPGDHILIPAGNRVPVDGTVIKGSSDIDMQIATGESRPVSATIGTSLYAGTLNLSAPIEIEAVSADEDSFLSDVQTLVEAGAQAKSRYTRLADRVARAYVPIVHSLALLTFFGWFFLGGEMRPALINAIAVLLITCPCALGLAVPAVQIVTTGRLFDKGILVKSGDALERLVKIKTVIFDKTGTLTKGEPELVNAENIDKEALRIAASLGRNSRHPLSIALQKHIGVDPLITIDRLHEVSGCGLEGQVNGQVIRFGSSLWTGQALKTDEAHSISWLIREDQDPVAFHFSDPARSDALETIQALQDIGLETVLLSGDQSAIAARIGLNLGMDKVRGDMMPSDKLTYITELQEAGQAVMMVGDGINDAPALAHADVSIAMASASDIASAASDIVIQKNRLSSIPEALRLSKMADQRIRENLGIAIVYNLFAIPIAVLGFVTPLIAAVAMSGSSLIVTLNALRMSRA